MPNLFGLPLDGIIADALKSAGGLVPATLTKITPGTRTAGSLTSGTNPTSASYTTTGIAEPGGDRDFSAGAGWQATGRERCKISLVGKPLNDAGITPQVDDTITIEGKTWTIKVQDPDGRDPAGAMYVSVCVGA